MLEKWNLILIQKTSSLGAVKLTESSIVFKVRNIFSSDSSTSGSQEKYAQVVLPLHHKLSHWHSYENMHTGLRMQGET